MCLQQFFLGITAAKICVAGRQYELEVLGIHREEL